MLTETKRACMAIRQDVTAQAIGLQFFRKRTWRKRERKLWTSPTQTGMGIRNPRCEGFIVGLEGSTKGRIHMGQRHAVRRATAGPGNGTPLPARPHGLVRFIDDCLDSIAIRVYDEGSVVVFAVVRP